jgi:hypothetical protein
MSFIIESEESKRYLQEENAIDGFRVAVNNGQTRLALQILVTIIDTFSDIFDAMIGDEDEAISDAATPIEEKVEEVKPTEVEETKLEEAKKPVAKKPIAKEESTTVSE